MNTLVLFVCLFAFMAIGQFKLGLYRGTWIKPCTGLA